MSVHASLIDLAKIFILILELVSFVLVSGVGDLPTDLFDPVIGTESGVIHVITSTDCYHPHFTYQSLALNYSFTNVHQSGRLTRLISCDQADVKERLTPEDSQIMDSLIVPDWSTHPETGDYYPPYNRPVSLIYWLKERKPAAEWTLILHPDMIFRQAISVSDFNLPEGYAASSYYSYLVGVSNKLADLYLPGYPVRTDMYGGLKGRKADQSGAFLFIRTRDLIKVAPLWWKLTGELRNDSRVWNLTGDVQLQSGSKSWLSEVYGYSFATTMVGLKHKVDPVLQAYPGYAIRDVPSIIHYGLSHRLGSFGFDKQNHKQFDAFKCPPWTISETSKIEGGLFPHPPFPKSIKQLKLQQRYGDLMIIEFANTLNKALCQRHLNRCPHSEELVKECETVDSIDAELKQEFQKLHNSKEICKDEHIKCKHWVEDRKCEKNWLYMIAICRYSCGKCRITHYSATPNILKKHLSMHQHAKNETEKKEKDLELERKRCLELSQHEFLEDSHCQLLMQKGVLIRLNETSHSFYSKDNSQYAKLVFRLTKIGFLVTFFIGLILFIFLTLKDYRYRNRRINNQKRLL